MINRSSRQLPTFDHSISKPAYVPGALQVKLKEDLANELPDVNLRNQAAARGLTLPSRADESFADLRKKRYIQEVLPVFSSATEGRPVSAAPRSVAAALVTSVRDSENEDLRGINIIQLSKSADVEQIKKILESNDAVEYVHRLPARWPKTVTVRAATATSIDPLANRQWGLRAIGWFGINPVPDASPVKVAVLDTGLDAKHPDLQGCIATYTHKGATAQDIVGHGTHISGIIAATNNNKIGVTGMCRCELHVWKVFRDKPDEDGDYCADEVMYQRALDAAHRKGIRVANLSVGSTIQTQTEETLIKRLIDSGCVIVAAMGNEFYKGNPIEYPAAYENVIAVGSIDEINRRAATSNTGRHIALVAPGVNILSTVPMKASSYRTETQYASWSGTSMATPYVSAAAALILAGDLSLSPQEVAKRLKDKATKVPAMKKRKKTIEYGAGLLKL